MISLRTQHYLLISNLIIFVSFRAKINSVEGKECGSVDVRRNLTDLEHLRNCTVIKGSVNIILIKNVSDDNYSRYKFPELREITGFLLFYDNAGLTSIGKLFPNLKVIRGRRLFMNYALAVYDMPDLKRLDLKSLLAIQRGHVFIDRCPKLCNLNTINWNKLTLTHGMNHVKQYQSEGCQDEGRGCGGYFWSNISCQKFYDDKFNNSQIPYCHALCLGECKNTTNSGCFVCKSYSDNGVCVDSCPPNKFLSEDDFRCYTKKQCQNYQRFTFQGKCLVECPPGYKGNSSFECIPCTKECPKICESKLINSLDSSESYRGCTIINGSLILNIITEVYEQILIENLSEIREIRGFVRIFRTPSITSMELLKNLEIIHGNELYHDHYGLILYGNKNLTKLWNWAENKSIEMHNGGLFIHSNYKLCNSEVSRLKNNVKHNNTWDTIDYNDQEFSCYNKYIQVDHKVVSYDLVTLTWKMVENASEIILFYKEDKNETLSEPYDFEKDDCARNPWIKDAFPVNSSIKQWQYNLTELKQNTKYAYFIKVLSNDKDYPHLSESKINFFTTLSDIPMSPMVFTLNKSTDAITLEWVPVTDENQVITYYVVDIFVHLDNQELLDTRNHCTDPFIPEYTPVPEMEEDYDDCCSRMEEEKEDYELQHILGQKYRCSLDIPHSCDGLKYTHKSRQVRNPNSGNEIPEAHKSKYYLRSQNISANNNFTTIKKLKHFTLYIFQFFACNDLGCGAYSLHAERTDPAIEADDISLEVYPAEQRKQYYLEFHQPTDPNGVTVAYNVILRRTKAGKFQGFLWCVSRREHEMNKYRYLVKLNFSDYKVTVRSVSLAGPGRLSPWVPIHFSYLPPDSNLDLIMFFTFILIIISAVFCWGVHRRCSGGIQRLTFDNEDDILLHGIESISRDNDDEEEEASL